MDKSHPNSIVPFFDGNNYAYLKVRMRTFLKSIDDQVWVSVVAKGFVIPPVPRPQWSKDQLAESSHNIKGLNSIFKVVSVDGI